MMMMMMMGLKKWRVAASLLQWISFSDTFSTTHIISYITNRSLFYGFWFIL
jgi:hypothetical protein